jgi:flagellar motor switch protein FliG
MSNSEEVDGPGIAAAILSKMREERKDRLMRAIKDSDPQIAAKVEEKLYDFDKLLELTPQSLQLLLQSISDRDLILSLKTASEATTKAIYHNLSERKAEYIKGEFENTPPVRLAEVLKAQKRILDKLEEFLNQGSLKVIASKDIWV